MVNKVRGGMVNKVHYHTIAGALENPIEVTLTSVTDRGGSNIRHIAYQKDGLIIAEGPEIAKWISHSGWGSGIIEPRKMWDDEYELVLLCDDLDGYTGYHKVCTWDPLQPTAVDYYDGTNNTYHSRPLAFVGDVYAFFRDLESIAANNEYKFTVAKCRRFNELNPNATHDDRAGFIRSLLNKYYKVECDGLINRPICEDIFHKVEVYLKFDAERKARNKAKKTAAKKAKKRAAKSDNN